MNKSECRAKAWDAIRKLSQSQKEWASQAIIDELISSKAFKGAKTICIYMNLDCEPSTYDLIGLCLALEKTVCVPKIYTDGSMKPIIISPYTDFGKDLYGILTPAKGKVAPFIDLSITPLLAFDNELNRLGKGKAFYDNFFVDYPCKKIGVAFDCQGFDKIPIEDHDVKMDMIITEKRVIFNDGVVIENDMLGEIE